MKRSVKYILGAFLIILGILFITGEIGFPSLSRLVNNTWPLLFIGGSFLFFMGYLGNRRPDNAGLLVPAGIFLVMGLTFLFGEIFSYRIIWPGFIAAPAVGLLLLYIFGGRKPGILVPVGILLTITGICFFSELFNAWDILWPGFILAPAVGLMLLYIAGDREPGLLIPIFILTGISLTLFTVFSLGRFIWLIKYFIGGIFIVGGMFTIIKKPSSKRYSDTEKNYGAYEDYNYDSYNNQSQYDYNDQNKYNDF
jgi:hypothetical protein